MAGWLEEVVYIYNIYIYNTMMAFHDPWLLKRTSLCSSARTSSQRESFQREVGRTRYVLTGFVQKRSMSLSTQKHWRSRRRREGNPNLVDPSTGTSLAFPPRLRSPRHSALLRLPSGVRMRNCRQALPSLGLEDVKRDASCRRISRQHASSSGAELNGE